MFGLNFFRINIFLVLNYFLTQKYFLDQKVFLTRKFLYKTFLGQRFCDPKTSYRDQKNFGAKNFVGCIFLQSENVLFLNFIVYHYQPDIILFNSYMNATTKQK